VTRHYDGTKVTMTFDSRAFVGSRCWIDALLYDDAVALRSETASTIAKDDPEHERARPVLSCATGTVIHILCEDSPCKISVIGVNSILWTDSF